MKFFVDFDNTLTDTVGFFQKFYQILLLREAQVTERALKTAYGMFASGPDPEKPCFSPESHMEALEISPRTRRGLAKRVQDEICERQGYLLPGAKAFLETLQNEECFLLTFGDPIYQSTKIAAAGIEDFFQEIIITQGRKEKEIATRKNREESCVFIDDKEKFFGPMKKRFGDSFFGIHMCHSAIGKHCDGCEADAHAHNFEELTVITQKLRLVS